VPPPIAELTARAQSLTSAGDLVGARNVLAPALDPVDADPQHASPDLALAAALHARILIALGDPHAARTWAGFAHAAEEKLHGPHDERTIAAAATHAAVLARVGNHGRATQLYHDLVLELTARDGRESQRVLAAEADLATAEHATGHCTAARARLAEAGARHRRVYGDATPAGIKMLARLGAMERECGRHAESDQHLSAAQELCARYLPDGHPLAAQTARLAAAPATGRHRCGRVQQSVGPEGPAPGVTPVRESPPGVHTLEPYRPAAPGPPMPVPPPLSAPSGAPPSSGPPPNGPPLGPARHGPSPVSPSPSDPPSQGFPSHGFPSQDFRSEDLRSEDFPSEDFPSEDLPSEDLPSEDLPPEDLPPEDLPPEDFPPEDPPLLHAPPRGPGGDPSGMPPPRSPAADPSGMPPPRGPAADPSGMPPPDNRVTDPQGAIYQQPIYLSDLRQPPGEATGRHARADTPLPMPGQRLPEYTADGRRVPVGSAPVGTGDVPVRTDRRLPVPVIRDGPSSSRGPFVLAAVLVAGIGVAAAVVAATLPRDPAASPAPTGSAAPPAATAAPVPSAAGSAAPGAGAGAPAGVRLRDNRDSVTLTWTYPKGSEGPVLISGGRRGEPQRAFQQLPAGSSDYMVYGLNEQLDYCFTVAVVHSTDKVAASQAVCTSRR
jgi:hypothetical protein